MRIKERYFIEDLKKIYEENYSLLKQKATSKIKYRAKYQNMKSTYLGVTKEGKVRFKTTSATIVGRFYYQEILFKDLQLALQLLSDSPKTSTMTILALIMKGDIMLHCTDPSFKYMGWQYMAWKSGYGMKRETRFPKVRNPRLKGSICKHLFVVLTVLPFYIAEINRDFKKKKIF